MVKLFEICFGIKENLENQENHDNLENQENQENREEYQEESYVETGYYYNINNLKLIQERVWTKFRCIDTWMETFVEEQSEAIREINEKIENENLKYYKLSFILEEFVNL